MTVLRVHRYGWLKGQTTSWLRVPYEHIKTLCLEKKISPWSKRQGKDVLLEKSVDAQHFAAAWEHFTKEPIELFEDAVVSSAEIRKLQSYYPN